MAEAYAIVESGGKQYRAEKGSELLVDRLPESEGAKLNLRAVMFRGEDVVVEPGQLEKVKVEAVVDEHVRGPKLRIFKYKAKKGYRRRSGHRTELTRLRVTEIAMLSRKPAAKKDQETKPKAKPKSGTASKSKSGTASKSKSGTASKSKSGTASKSKGSSASKSKGGGTKAKGKPASKKESS